MPSILVNGTERVPITNCEFDGRGALQFFSYVFVDKGGTRQSVIRRRT